MTLRGGQKCRDTHICCFQRRFSAFGDVSSVPTPSPLLMYRRWDTHPRTTHNRERSWEDPAQGRGARSGRPVGGSPSCTVWERRLHFLRALTVLLGGDHTIGPDAVAQRVRMFCKSKRSQSPIQTGRRTGIQAAALTQAPTVVAALPLPFAIF